MYCPAAQPHPSPCSVVPHRAVAVAAASPQAVAQRLSALLAGGEELDWVPDQPQRALGGGCSPYVEEIILYIKVEPSCPTCHSLLLCA